MKFIKLPTAIVICVTATLTATLATAQDTKPKSDDANPYVDATREMTDSMMQMMSGMLKIWKEASRPVWQTTSQMFGEYGNWCVSCHVELESIYDKVGDTLDAGIHQNLTDEALAKALEAYNKLKGSE